jgi:hypothetical protein
MATVKEKLAEIMELERRAEAGVAELHRGTREKVAGIKEMEDRVEAGVAELHRGTQEKVAGIKEMGDQIEADVDRIEKEIVGETDWMIRGVAEFDNYAREDFWG